MNHLAAIDQRPDDTHAAKSSWIVFITVRLLTERLLTERLVSRCSSNELNSPACITKFQLPNLHQQTKFLNEQNCKLQLVNYDTRWTCGSPSYKCFVQLPLGKTWQDFGRLAKKFLTRTFLPRTYYQKEPTKK